MRGSEFPGPASAALSEPPPSAPPPPPRPCALASIDAEVTIPIPSRRTGHWESTPTETWPGQLDFERARFERCAGVDESSARYLNAFDESGTLALWAEVPQELLDAELEYQIVELVPPRKAPPPPSEPVASVLLRGLLRGVARNPCQR